MSAASIPLPFRWHLLVKWRERALFSERNGYIFTLAIGPLRFTIRKRGQTYAVTP